MAPLQVQACPASSLPDEFGSETDSKSKSTYDRAIESGAKLIGVNGFWYDVTNFIDKHPGGPVLEHFIGKDCTTVFNANRHPDWVLKHRKPIGTYQMDNPHPADKDFDNLMKECEKRGWYDPDWSFCVQKCLIVIPLFLLVWICVCCFQSKLMHYLGAVWLYLLWQQSGYLMHDFMHGQMFQSIRSKQLNGCGRYLQMVLKFFKFKWSILDRICGTFFGTVMLGVSGHWWREEHSVHHGLTNVVDVETNFADPQMRESAWAQSTLLFPLFKGWLQYFLIKIQHITFVPAVVICGRFVLIYDSYILERRWYEWVAISLHWSWVVLLLSYLPTWSEVFTFYAIAAALEGISHFQLILSHTARAFHNLEDFQHQSWYVSQILSNMNISNPWWFDWYYGGLNFHIEHHIFPKLGRRYLRTIAPEVKAICQKHGIEYGMESFSGILLLTLRHLKETSVHYSLDLY